jgi:hypothetical protein
LVTDDRPLDLEPNQGLLVIHIDSSFPIRRLQFGTGLNAATDLRAGGYLALLAVRAGSYRWTTLEIPIGTDGRYYRFRLRRDSDWNFKVKAGHINYPGQVIVRGDRSTLMGEGSLQGWTANRPALALEGLRKSHPTTLSRLPLANGRSVRDDFLKIYQKIAPFKSSGTTGSASD